MSQLQSSSSTAQQWIHLNKKNEMMGDIYFSSKFIFLNFLQDKNLFLLFEEGYSYFRFPLKLPILHRLFIHPDLILKGKNIIESFPGIGMTYFWLFCLDYDKVGNLQIEVYEKFGLELN